ncbi:serine/threonine protein kinase, partial [Streptomyces sp. SID3212]|nr:serine/threonine protein kinase [Streptomyces sp. SID3212]
VLPSNAAAFDPNAATSFLPFGGHAGPGGPGGPGQGYGAPGPNADPTSVMPPVPPGEPDGPHPWQSQLQAARDRNEQTQVQYLDPSQDPLRRRPHRPQPPRQQQPPAPPANRQASSQGYPPPQQPQSRRQQQQQQPQQQRYAPPPPQQQQYAPPQPPPQQPAPRQPREPRQPRQRTANPMRIPGLGCLKGCLFTLVVLFVAGWLVWELTPLQDWIGTSKGFLSTIGDGISKVTDWFSRLTDSTGTQ